MRSETEQIPDDAHIYVLFKLLHGRPDLSQRDLARKTGLSLGKVNYCLKALVDKGFIKAINFKNSRKKSAYLYKLTPTGLKEKARVTCRFLKRKEKEYDRLKAEIEELRAESYQLSVNSYQLTVIRLQITDNSPPTTDNQ